MQRRELLRLIGGAAIPASIGLTAADLLTAGRRLGAQEPRRGPLPPFNARQRETVATLAELIIPATDTPGARAARVDEYIALLLNEWYLPEKRTEFTAGLSAFDARSVRDMGGPFTALTPRKQVAFLTALDAESLAPRAANTPTPFFLWMKRLTVSGYYTSEIGMTQELRTVIWPGRYDGCRAIGSRPQGARS